MLQVWWARLWGYVPPQRWGYLPTDRPRWKGVWSRLASWLRRPEPRADRSDGRDYRGWTALVVSEMPELAVVPSEHPVLPVGARGAVRDMRRRSSGELVHTIEFPMVDMTTPLPRPGIELIEP